MIRDVLTPIQVNPSAKILALLARNTKGKWDRSIKETLKESGVDNLAPHFRRSPKCAKRSKIMAEPKKEPHPGDGGEYVYFKSFVQRRSEMRVYRKNVGWFRGPR